MLSTKQWVGVGLLGAALTAAGLVGVGHLRGWRSFDGPINALEVDLSQPHAYVRTSALSKLPRDLIKAPVLRDLLTEDFAFYYEEHEDRLGLSGAIKRIAFEHDLSISDQLLQWALDEPAELALWADAKGAPRHWTLAMTRGTLAKALQGLAGIAGGDAQLSLIATLKLNGNDVPVHALTLSPRRTLALATLGNRVVVLSDPGLVFDGERNPDPRSSDVLAKLLSGDAKEQAVLAATFGLPAQGSGHALVVDARLASQGYQHFFPGLKAVRMDVSDGGANARTWLRAADAQALPTSAQVQSLWAAVPANPAACAQVPTDTVRLQGIASGAGAPTEALQAVLAQLEGPAAICWYARSQLHTPLLVMQTKAGQSPKAEQLLAVWQWLMSSKGSPAASDGLFKASMEARWGGTQKQGQVFYEPALAQQSNWVSFSPDMALVSLARDTQSKRFPSVADATPSTANVGTLAVVTPKLLADMAQEEAFAVLPPKQELLHQAARQHLIPRLNALRQLPASRAVPDGKPDAQGWVAVSWQALKAE